MNEKKAAIIAKIEKLMIHAASTEGTPEGKIFRRKAALMMAEHRIEESELDMDQGNLVMDQFEFFADGPEVPQWVGDVISTFGYCFDVQTIRRRFTWEDLPRYEWDFVGTMSDVETVSYFVEVVVRHIEKAGWEAWPNERNWRKRNQLGNVAAQVIWDRAYKLKQDMDVTMHEDEACTALVVSKKDMPNDSTTLAAGIAAGNSAPLNFAISD